MRKRILFLQGGLGISGISKALINLLNVIDYHKYEVSLFVLNEEGALKAYIPNNVKIISVDKKVSYVCAGLAGLFPLVKGFYPLYFLFSLFRMFVSVFNKGYSALLLSQIFPKNDEKYDLIVDWSGQQLLYYMVDQLKAVKKVSFFHSDYGKWHYYYSLDKKYYSKVDKIFSISETCVNSLKKFFPKESHKIGLMENIISVELLYKLSNEQPDEIIEKNKIVFVTIGHVSENKGTDLAIKAAKILKKNGIDFKWYFIGKVINDYSILIQKYHLEHEITFLGVKLNPYPYIKAANILVHTSLFEGKSVALDEAKILCKPIVVTDFSTVHDQFVNGVNALIADFAPEDIATKMQRLLEDKVLRDSLVENLKRNICDNSTEVNKLYSLL